MIARAVRFYDRGGPEGLTIENIDYGVLDPNATRLPLQTVIAKNMSLLGFAMYPWDRPERNARAIEFIRSGVARGLLRPLNSKQCQLDEIVAAASYLDSMEQIGKVVVSTK
jgi:NADPH:quinone reductase-like Zn-dependent oxidoreductase